MLDHMGDELGRWWTLGVTVATGRLDCCNTV